MQTNATTVLHMDGPARRFPGFSGAPRALRLALFALLALVLVGEHGARTQTINGINLGVDPFRVLDLQLKPNVVVVLDTSGSMQEDPYTNNTRIGGDDPSSKMYQAKQAINAVLLANQTKFNFGFATYNQLNSDKLLVGNPDPTVTYVTRNDEPGAYIWTGGNSYFSTNPGGTDFRYTGFSTAADDARVWRSFVRNSASVRGPGCAPGVSCKLILFSRLYRSGMKFKWSTTATGAAGQASGVGTSDILLDISPIDCSAFPPPAGMFPEDPAGVVRPCIQMQNNSATNPRTTTFWYSSIRWNPGSAGNVCDGAAVLQNVAACGVDNVPVIRQYLQLEIPMWDIANPTANSNTCGGPMSAPCSLVPAVLNTTAPSMNSTNPAVVAGLDPNVLGVAAAQFTPLGATLEDLYNSFPTVFPNPGGALGAQQRNFVILLTDGAETCGSNAPLWASNLYARSGHAGGQWAETIVIGFSLAAASQTTLNAIACAGSGGTISSCNSTTCSCTGGLRRNAYSAADLDTLIAALQNALAESISSGVYSASPSQVASIFEYVGTAPSAGADPRDPTTRFKVDLPILFQPSFEVPGYKGRLRAFKSDLAPVNPVAVQVWEAGQKLLDRVVNEVGAMGAPVPWTISTTANKYTFDQLHAFATTSNVGTSSARVKRRIVSSRSNGVNPSVEALWPPSSAVAPSVQPAGVNDVAGVLDTALGLTYPSEPDDAARFAKLQADFGACTGTNLPVDCSSANATLKYTEARREARELVLAWTAGARAVRDDANVIQREATGRRILFESRSCGNLADATCPGLLGESTNSTPAVIGQVPDSPPERVLGEKNAWLLLRDGPRTAAGNAIDAVDQGFGLNSPDADGKEKPPNTTGTFRVNLKPAMDVVYYGGNDMLHAFRAGPQCTAPTGPCPGTGDETGGEELWGFVPFDQLGKLSQLMTPRPRTNRVYMIASSLRFARVFIPGSFSIGTTSYTGRWRTVLLFGRGPGGKHYTALDVTTAGPFTRDSLQTILPTVMWNRGNPDTDDGRPKTGANSYNGSAADYTAYLDMGLTFSVPGVGRVTRSSANNNVEFIAYTGSGYSNVSNEGRRIYALDLVRGDVIHSFDPGNATTDPAYPPNAVVAGPSVFIPTQLETSKAGNPYGELATRVYVPDLHGRIWRFDTEDWGATTVGAPFFDFGPDQPIGVPLALLNYRNSAAGETVNRPYVFGETGNDERRVAPPAFKLFALRELDDGTAERAFPDQSLPVEPTSPTDPTLVYYRGTAQPVTIFNKHGYGRVFYLATVFKPCTDPPFESALFALTAATGEAAYDLNDGDDRRIDIPNLLLSTPLITSQGVVSSEGLAAGQPPPPPGGPTDTVGTSGPNAQVLLSVDQSGAAPTVRMGSSACR